MKANWESPRKPRPTLAVPGTLLLSDTRGPTSQEGRGVWGGRRRGVAGEASWTRTNGCQVPHATPSGDLPDASSCSQETQGLVLPPDCSPWSAGSRGLCLTCSEWRKVCGMKC